MADTTLDPRPRTANEIEREVDAERQRVADTIDALQRKVSVGNIVDEVVRSVGEHGGDVSRNLANSLRQNPLAVILTGVGLTWLIAGSGAPPRNGDDNDELRRWQDDERRYRTMGEADFGTRSEFATDDDELSDGDDAGAYYGGGYEQSGIRDRISGAAASVSAGAASASESIREGAASMSEGIREGAGSVRSSVSGLAGRAGDLARHAPSMHDVRRRVARSGRSGLNGLESFFDEQPLVAGALALALGAAIGSALPRTRTEDELFGAESDRVKQNLRATAEHEGNRAMRAAAAVADEAKSIAGEAADELAASGAAAVDRMGEAIDDASARLGRRAADEASTEEASTEEVHTTATGPRT